MTLDAAPIRDPLNLSRRVLRALLVGNIVLGALILLLFVASIVAQSAVMSALRARPAAHHSTLYLAMRLIMVVGLLAVPLTHMVLSRLLAIVATVRSGDPFVSQNAVRLSDIAWSVLGLEVLHLIAGLIAARVPSADESLDINWSFSLTRALCVLLLFVLARVFEDGARMREELEGTI
jgi:hypothetical protein